MRTALALAAALAPAAAFGVEPDVIIVETQPSSVPVVTTVGGGGAVPVILVDSEGVFTPGRRSVGASGSDGAGFGFGPEHFEAMVYELLLDQEQAGQVGSLAEDARVRAAALLQEFTTQTEEAVKSLKEAEDWGAISESLDTIMSGYSEAIEGVREGFFADVRLLLLPEQDELWPRYERAARRIDHLRGGEFAGEGVDLFHVLDDTELSNAARSTAAGVLEEYAGAVDVKILARERAESDAVGVKETLKTFDVQKLMESQRSVREAAHALAELNRSYARRIAEAIGGEAGDAFAETFRRESYPALFTRRYPEELLALLDRDDSLTVEQFDAIERVRTSYETRRDRYIARQIKARSDFERDMLREGNKRGPRTVSFSFTWKDGQTGEKLVEASYVEIMELREERAEMEQATAGRLLALLDDSQRERLPVRAPGKGKPGEWDEGESITVTTKAGEKTALIEIVKKAFDEEAVGETDGAEKDDKD